MLVFILIVTCVLYLWRDLSWAQLQPVFMLYIVHFIGHRHFSHGIHQYPGPFVASITNIWRVAHVYLHGNERPTYLELHRRYGRIVRVGPNALSFSSPSAIEDIYGPKNNMAKSNWYIAFEAHGKGPKKENIFSTRDNHWHARYRELVEPGFRMEQLLRREEEVDSLLLDLLANLDASCADNASSTSPSPSVVDQLHYFVFDAGGIFAFSQPYGFLKTKSDLEGIMQTSRVLATHLMRLSQTPVWQFLLDKNPLVLFLGFVPPPMAFAQRYLPLDRIRRQVEQHRDKDKRNNEDVLDTWIEAHTKHPDVVTRNDIIDLGLMLISPTPDAVRTTLVVVIYHVLKSNAIFIKLRSELDENLSDNKTTIPPWSFLSNLTRFPYLSACIKEALRIHPPPGFMMERVVPPTGSVVDGHYIPSGTLVSCSPWVIHHDQGVFGDDTEVFRPERWLEGPPEQMQKMESLLCPFGFRSRVCLGMDMALLEIHKVAAVLFRHYEMSLPKPEKDLSVIWGNMVCVDTEVRLKRRQR
ncbi:cytochrome P450 [Aspergillus granulosus]|uniref:Cytochrome P450 n=1 Tax=Aspergillus granulosus TaxID=176169 RepID=A0ABR4HEP7_9EURO